MYESNRDVKKNKVINYVTYMMKKGNIVKKNTFRKIKDSLIKKDGMTQTQLNFLIKFLVYDTNSDFYTLSNTLDCLLLNKKTKEESNTLEKFFN